MDVDHLNVLPTNLLTPYQDRILRFKEKNIILRNALTSSTFSYKPGNDLYVQAASLNVRNKPNGSVIRLLPKVQFQEQVHIDLFKWYSISYG